MKIKRTTKRAEAVSHIADTARLVRGYLRDSGEKTLFIVPGSPWENGHIESFNGELRGECPDGELFLSLAEARYICGRLAVVL
jgi:transposase InsO family protein